MRAKSASTVWRRPAADSPPRLGRLIDNPAPLAAAECFAKHLANEFPAVFLFLCDPSPVPVASTAARRGHRPTRAMVATTACRPGAPKTAGSRTAQFTHGSRRWFNAGVPDEQTGRQTAPAPEWLMLVT